ncbi:MAG: hypothetical protein NTX66_04180 [Candidatus Falkowbacteria bacterium]|nr:hypothetical protein [Candidatus Falkowbacteria bacterium]
MNFKEIIKPAHFNKLLIVLSVIVVLVFVFTAGIFIGHEKARFSQAWGEHYYRNIIGPGRPGWFGMMDFGRPDFNAHSGLGQIIKIDGNNIVIKDQANLEKIILVTDKTAIVKDNQNIKITDLKIDDNIIIIGRPNNQGQIEPRLIRVLPAGSMVQPD